MRKSLLSFACILFFVTIAIAQEEKAKKGCGCSYAWNATLGILNGEAGAEFQVQTIQGIRYGKWFSGIGVGLDYYEVRGIPLFLDIRREFFNNKHKPFIYADGGIHFPWATPGDKDNYGKTTFSNGAYYDVGVGYRLASGKHTTFLLSAGYTYKYMKEERISPMCLGWDCSGEMREKYTYGLNRLSMKFGVQF